MSRKLIFLMGAPTPGSLNWDEDKLFDGPIPPFSGENVSDRGNLLPSDAPAAKWRLLQDHQLFEQTSTQDNQQEPLFFTTRDLVGDTTEQSVLTATGDTSAAAGDIALSQFYDHSIAIHEESRVSFSESAYLDSTHDETSILTEESTRYSFETQPGDDREVAETRFPSLRGHLSDLKDIPNAGYLRSIVPQTMTVNLIVGIIAVYPPRRVTTRRWKREMDIVELVVGDETRTGFGLTFWIPPGHGRDRPDQDGLGKTLAGLRPRDIILVRTLGLSSFRERVYGQGLARGMTKIDLVHRQPVDRSDSCGLYSTRAVSVAGRDEPHLLKTRRVREWIWQFVGSGPDGAGGDGGMSHGHAQQARHLPPDTQE
ncbi:hypothetical protein VTN00DRAFT_10297 [Thermoascus crustaceus]|uniref:uncharacterized protein n=1 Tax=Thermoascus crustaceus TaxID=5088 RepID=UPI0037444A5F